MHVPYMFSLPLARCSCRSWKGIYNYYVGYQPELFDLKKDPLEEKNLAREPAHAAERVRLDQMLRQIVDPEATDAKARAAQAALI